jgi:dipeptidyl aminopeptidase/acylaminoacyl peptidase
MRTLVCLAALSAAATPASPAPLSFDDWFGGPRVQQVAISPDARYLSLIVIDGEQSYVAVKDRTAKSPAAPVFATDPGQAIDPRFCGWVSERRLVCRFAGRMHKSGEGEYVSRLVAMDADGKNRRNLLISSVSFGAPPNTDNLNVAAWRTSEPNTILVSGWFPGSKGYAVAKVNTSTGTLRLVAKPKDGVTVFQDDEAGNVLLAGGIPSSWSREKKVRLYGRRSNEDDWLPLTRLGAHEDDPGVALISVTPGAPTAYTLMQNEGRRALFKMDLTDKVDPELVYWHAQRDIEGVLRGPRSQLLGVWFASSALGPQYLDPRAAALDAALRKSFPKRWNWFSGSSDDEKTHVIRTSSASEAAGYYVLDTANPGVKFEAIGSEWPGLARMILPETSTVGLQTRDGRLKEVLFTPAAGVTGKAPLVVFAGGTQQTGGFEPATYFLASRGIAVLRTYFTGSDQEREWWRTPYLDWNGALMDELFDATRWAAQRPDVDATKICIVGRNLYGGYQALLAAARADTPFKCAASMQGFSDLAKVRKRASRAEIIGEFRPQTSDDRQAKESPLARAAEFRVPVFLVEEGVTSHDPSDDEGGWEMAAALKAANKPHELHLIKEADEAYLIAAYTALEKFLDKHLR